MLISAFTAPWSFFKGSPSAWGKARQKYGFLVLLRTSFIFKLGPALNNSYTTGRAFTLIDVNTSMASQPPDMGHIPSPDKWRIRMVPLWNGAGDAFNSQSGCRPVCLV